MAHQTQTPTEIVATFTIIRADGSTEAAGVQYYHRKWWRRVVWRMTHRKG